MVLDEWSWGDPWWSWTTWTWYHNWNMAVFWGVFLGGQSNGSNGKALLSWVTSPNLHPVDKRWASSMVITLAGLGPKQKLLSMMRWSFWRIFWPCPTSTQWTWGGPPLWLSPWRAWDQNKRCLAWWADHFDIFFDRVRPRPGGHGVGLLRGYHPDRLGTKTKVAWLDVLSLKMYFDFCILKVQPHPLVHSENQLCELSIWEQIVFPKSCL